MKIYTIWGQRRCRYEQEYAPELLEAIDEFGDSDNPDFLPGKVKEYEKSKEFERVEVIILVLPRAATDAIMERMSGNLKVPAALAGKEAT